MFLETHWDDMRVCTHVAHLQTDLKLRLSSTKWVVTKITTQHPCTVLQNRKMMIAI